MRQSILFYRTYKDLNIKEEAKNSQLLLKAGYIEKVAAGIYNFLPLGFLTLEKIKKVIREELNKLNCQEVFLANLHPKEFWEVTGRWTKFDALFKLRSKLGQEYSLAPTHEEIIFPLIKKVVNSYRDLPIALYQINSKYRDELRSKSGLLRNKEFIMKDLYSFHPNNENLEKFKKRVEKTYLKIFKKCGLKAIPTLASGGSFSKFSLEFQVITPAGEDTIFYCSQCQQAWNKEILNQKNCPLCNYNLEVFKSIEIANTFNLGTRFSEYFEVYYLDKNNKKNYIWAGCYGIGLTRLLGAIVEVNHDDKGITWPPQISPFTVHLILFQYNNQKLNKNLKKLSENIYDYLNKNGIEVIFDDRLDVSNGQKLVEADLIGIPYQIIIGENSLKNNLLEVKIRSQKKLFKINKNNLIKWLK